MGGTNTQPPAQIQSPQMGALRQQTVAPIAAEGGWNIASSHPEAIAQGIAGGMTQPKKKGQVNPWSEMVKGWVAKGMDRKDGFQQQYGNDTSPED